MSEKGLETRLNRRVTGLQTRVESWANILFLSLSPDDQNGPLRLCIEQHLFSPYNALEHVLTPRAVSLTPKTDLSFIGTLTHEIKNGGVGGSKREPKRIRGQTDEILPNRIILDRSSDTGVLTGDDLHRPGCIH